MILTCTSPPDAIYTNIKSAEICVAKRPGSTVGLWPDRSDRFGRW